MVKKRSRKSHHKREQSPLRKDVLIVFGILLFLAGLLKACAPAPPPPEPPPVSPLPPSPSPAPSPIEEIEEEPEEVEEPEETPKEEEKVEEVVVEEVEEEPATKTHNVLITKEGFVPEELIIEVGDTVIFENQRQINSLKSAVVVGNSRCNKVKSGVLSLGESYEYTFTKTTNCQVLETIIKSAIMTIKVG